ncbi:hypothetical protein G4B88_023534 [Cannabis sativa]|uniref:LRAT domain-containing protein n=1 Tax=Cannabis sativa TaxID=3483 RepID=A0A7J6HX20_CANSA|nr:hypothetical protein G4B88_023534 [Cannabis sativa]
MGLISNNIKASQLKPGDHIYSYRRAHTYSHHGIYVGENRVIHFTRTKIETSKKLSIIRRIYPRKPCEECNYNLSTDKGVVKTCLNCFLKKHRLFRFKYNVSMACCLVKKSGSCSTSSPFTPEKVIQRATEMFERTGKLGFGDYHPIENNCESFVFYCTTSSRKSMQGNSFKALVEAVYQTTTDGEHDSIKAIGVSIVKKFFKNKAQMINDDQREKGEITDQEEEEEEE